MPTNDTGYEIIVGPDNNGAYSTVQPGDDYADPAAVPATEVDPPVTDTGTAAQSAQAPNWQALMGQAAASTTTEPSTTTNTPTKADQS